ncbi:MAG: GtrA family protein [Maricaulaceae bacterium]
MTVPATPPRARSQQLAALLRDQRVRYLIAGGLVTAIYWGITVAGGALAWAPMWVNSTIGFWASVAAQYGLQSKFVFARRARDLGQGLRFAAAILLGYAVSTLIAGVLGPSLGWPPALAATLVVVWIPIQNFVLFTFWVFRAPQDAAP